MTAYFTAVVGFVVLGCYEFILFRWWRRRLTDLASHYDLAERRKRASRQSLVVMLLVYLPALAVLLVSIVRSSVSGYFIVSLLILALAPTFIWHIRQVAKLRTLGYYGGQP